MAQPSTEQEAFKSLDQRVAHMLSGKGGIVNIAFPNLSPSSLPLLLPDLLDLEQNPKNVSYVGPRSSDTCYDHAGSQCYHPPPKLLL